MRLPEDLAEYFRTVDGMDDGEYDEHQFRFWPIAELQPAAEYLPEQNEAAYDGYYVFADYSIWVHFYAVRLSSKCNEVVLVGEGAPIQVAASFKDFLQRSLREPDSLL